MCRFFLDVVVVCFFWCGGFLDECGSVFLWFFRCSGWFLICKSNLKKSLINDSKYDSAY